jgi:hypothetical protein
LRYLQPDQRVRLQRRAKKSWQRKLNHRAWLRRKRIADILGEILRDSSVTIHGETLPAIVLAPVEAAPIIFCLENNGTEVSNFLSRLRDHIDQAIFRAARLHVAPHHRGRPIVRKHIDFTVVSEITPPAALALAAEYDRLYITTGNRPWAVNLSRWNPVVLATLDQLGFFQLLEIRSAPPPQEGGAYPYILQFRRNTRANGDDYGRFIDDVEVAVRSRLGKSDVDFDRLFTALGEAAINTHQHAYPSDEPSVPVGINHWWVTAAVNQIHKRFTVVIYDQGVTIPGSLPKWDRWEPALAIIRRLTGMELNILEERLDGAAIAAAIEVSSSSTAHTFRGKGLGEMKAFIGTCRRGRLRILSRRGEYIYETGSDPRHQTNDIGLRGTLIEWDIWL